MTSQGMSTKGAGKVEEEYESEYESEEDE